MIPNTDINCGKCATPIYSDCVMWSGKNLSCVTLLQDCCDTSLTKVVELLGDYVCNMGGGLTWGCTASGATTSTNDTFQAIINGINNNVITYNSNHFVVSGTNCTNKGLSLKTSTWTTATETSMNPSFTYLPNNNTAVLAYIKNSLGEVRLNGTVRTYNGGYIGSGIGQTQILQLPPELRPAQDTYGNQFVCFAYIDVAGNQPTPPAYSTETVTIATVKMSRIIMLHGKVYSNGWIYIEFPFDASYHIYLQTINYSLN